MSDSSISEDILEDSSKQIETQINENSKTIQTVRIETNENIYSESFEPETTKFENSNEKYELDESFNKEETNEYSEHFESEITKTQTRNTKQDYSDTFDSESSSSRKTTESYSESFCSEPVSFEGDSELFSNLVKRMKKNQRRKLEEIDTTKEEFDIKMEENYLKNVINRIKSNKEVKIDIPVNEYLVNRLKLKLFIKENEKKFDKKVDNFGLDLIHESYPQTRTLNREKELQNLKEKHYFKRKCDLIKFKQLSNKIDKHEEIYADSLMLIGELARDLPKHTLPSDQVWKMFLSPLKNKK